MELAEQGFGITSTLAETLRCVAGLSYRTVHRIVARAALLAVEQGYPASHIDSALMDQAAEEFLGRPLLLATDQIRSGLNPQQVTLRAAVRQILGDPA